MKLPNKFNALIRRLPRTIFNFHLLIVLLLFFGSILLQYPQFIPFLGKSVDPNSFLYLTRHSIGRLILILPITYTALVFGLQAGLLSLLVAVAITIPSLFTLEKIMIDDVIEIIGIVIIGLVVNLWLESYETDKKHRQLAYLRMENAQRELQHMQQNLRFYLKQITMAQEEERRRIAQELHDDTAQSLIALSRKVDSFITGNKNLNAADKEYLEELHEQINHTLSEVRRFSQDLRPSVLDDLGLVPALEWLADELSTHFGYKIDLTVEGDSRRLQSETELVLFRIAQEALRNIGKHAQARRAWIKLSFKPELTLLDISDNGRGFNLPDRIGDLAINGKLGLAGMQERVQLIGGHLDIVSKPGQGTDVTVEIPNSLLALQQPPA